MLYPLSYERVKVYYTGLAPSEPKGLSRFRESLLPGSTILMITQAIDQLTLLEHHLSFYSSRELGIGLPL